MSNVIKSAAELLEYCRANPAVRCWYVARVVLERRGGGKMERCFREIPAAPDFRTALVAAIG